MTTYNYQIKKRLMWRFHINNWHLNPKPRWRYLKEGMSTKDKLKAISMIIRHPIRAWKIIFTEECE